MSSYNSTKAWTRAAIFFVVATVIGVASGVSFHLLMDAGNAFKGIPILLSITYLVMIILAYGVIWPIGTLAHGRPRRPGVAIVFGTLWGLAQAQIFLSIWIWVNLVGLGPWWSALICYGIIAAYQGMWHGLYWDIHVSPPHNIRSWNGKKVALCHTPNLLFTLVLLATYDLEAAWVITIGQCLALVLSCWFMHFPAPGDPGAPDPQPDD